MTVFKHGVLGGSIKHPPVKPHKKDSIKHHRKDSDHEVEVIVISEEPTEVSEQE